MKPEENTAQNTVTVCRNTFSDVLDRHGLRFQRDKTTILQVNVGLKCNQFCSHCHLDAGPNRREMMSEETMSQVLRLAASNELESIDITGGAPELHPEIHLFVRRAADLGKKLSFRANLTALARDTSGLKTLLAEKGATIFASFPSINAVQAESLRGKNTFQSSLDGLKALNALGYGNDAVAGELNLVVNPAGAFLPPSQESLDRRFRKYLSSSFDIHFDHVYSFANVPLGRFRDWLVRKGNLDTYIQRLQSAFNPTVVSEVMCRRLMSIGWDGSVYDCDFNLAAGLFAGNRRLHVSQLASPLKPDSEIATGEHCFTCTAGTGFT